MRQLLFIIFLSITGFYAIAQDNLDSTHISLNKGYNTMESEDPIRALLFSGTGWYRHADIPMINGWLVRLAAASNIQVDVSETGADITEERLSNYDVIVFNNANVLDKVMNKKQREVIERWYEKGGGIVGLHALLVHQEGWPWMLELGGCDFNSDSDFQSAKIEVDDKATGHPILAGKTGEFWYEADWTNHTRSVTGLEGVQVLLRVDESTYEPVREFFNDKGGKPMGNDHPIAWIREWKGSRFFYTELGHDIRSLDTTFGRKHIIEGIKWVVDRK